MKDVTIAEIGRQLAMQIDNDIERFMVSEVQNYANGMKDRLTVTINAKKIYEAIKRQTPKEIGYDPVNCYLACPTCGRVFDNDQDNFCSRCGQAFMKTR